MSTIMKKILLLIILAGINVSVKSQITPAYKPLSSFKTDTLAFLQYNFGNRADAYKGQKFNLLMSDLQIPVTKILPAINMIHGRTSNRFYIFIYDPKRIENGMDNNNFDGCIRIDLRDIFQTDKVFSYLNLEDLKGLSNFFSNFIIHEVSLVETEETPSLPLLEMEYNYGSIVTINPSSYIDYTNSLKAKVSDHLTRPISYSIRFKLIEETELYVNYVLDKFYSPDKFFNIRRSFIKGDDEETYRFVTTKFNDKSYKSNNIILKPGNYTFISEMEAYDALVNINFQTKLVEEEVEEPTSYKSLIHPNYDISASFNEDSPLDFESFAYCNMSGSLMEPTAYTIKFRVNGENMLMKVKYDLSNNENGSFRIHNVLLKGKFGSHNLEIEKKGTNQYQSHSEITLPPGEYSLTTKMSGKGTNVNIDLLGKYAQ